jgi:hypothetical protein
MEAGYEPQHRTKVNLCAGSCALGKYAVQYDAQSPTVSAGVVEAGVAGHFSTLLQEISTDPMRIGKARGGNDECLMPVEKSDHLIVVLKPGNAGGAKGVTS